MKTHAYYLTNLQSSNLLATLILNVNISYHNAVAV